jgi:hypothetical protein
MFFPSDARNPPDGWITFLIYALKLATVYLNWVWYCFWASICCSCCWSLKFYVSTWSRFLIFWISTRICSVLTSYAAICTKSGSYISSSEWPFGTMLLYFLNTCWSLTSSTFIILMSFWSLLRCFFNSVMSEVISWVDLSLLSLDYGCPAEWIFWLTTETGA